MSHKLPINFLNLLIVATAFGCLEAHGQVVNDNIEDRLELIMNRPRHSSTADCTLQWGCLDHARTKKMIQYHNDQWFFFTATDSPIHYINIFGQSCRDLRGVQLMLIHGVSCEPENYDILDCVSLGDQNDVFMKLDQLVAGQEYLVLVDGYLNDNCSFEIEISDTPKGIPLAKMGIVPMEASSSSPFLLNIKWTVPDTLAAKFMWHEVYRRKDYEHKSILVHKVEQGFNSRGDAQQNYCFEDILPDYGMYTYHIVGEGQQTRMLISQHSEIHHPQQGKASTLSDMANNEMLSKDPADWLEVRLDFPKPCKLAIRVYQADTQNLLEEHSLVYNSVNHTFTSYIKGYTTKGIDYFRVEIKAEGDTDLKAYFIRK